MAKALGANCAATKMLLESHGYRIYRLVNGALALLAPNTSHRIVEDLFALKEGRTGAR